MEIKNHILYNISGFPEFSPDAQILFNHVIQIIREIYESSGAVPLETSAIERVEHLLAKGGNDKEIYGLHRLKGDDGDTKDYALHFDLTLPLARYVAQNAHHLTFPFKRYQIQPVWRGERAQKGRYRQFYQCDIDVIGEEQLSILYDAEIPVIIYKVFRTLEIGKFVIRINNRKILTGVLNHFGISGDDNIMEAINIIDDFEKQNEDKTKKRLEDKYVANDDVNKLLDFFKINLPLDEIFQKLESFNYGEIYTEGVSELKLVIEAISKFGIEEDYYKVDLSIARGLDYYTGTVYETKLVGYPKIGSICSGGRFDNLAENFSNKRYPGVGISIGTSRLLYQLMEAGIMKIGSQNLTPVLVTRMDQSYDNKYFEITTMLRDSGINTEIFLENKKLKKQISFANKKNIPFVIIAGEDEFKNNSVSVKNLSKKIQVKVLISNLVEYIKGEL